MSTAQDRDLNHLHPRFRAALERWLVDVRTWCKRHGLDVLVYETFRTAARQAYLYAQGRTRSGPIITQTLDSAHEYGVACDWVALRLVNGQWVQDWSHATYNAIYAACPPAKYGLEKLSWEAPHLQLAGVNGADQRQPVSAWAAREGIKANVITGSTWPLAVAAAPPAIIAGTPNRRRVFLRGLNGKNDVLSRPVVYGGQLVSALDGGDVQVGALRVRVYDDGALQLTRLEDVK